MMAVLLQVMTGVIQGSRVHSEASVQTEACQASQHCKADAVAISLPAQPSDQLAAPAHDYPSANATATPVTTDNSLRENCPPVGVTIYTEVNHTAEWGRPIDCFLLSTASVICNPWYCVEARGKG